MVSKLLEEAFLLARGLPEDEQEQLAARIFAELTADDAFDRKIAATAGRDEALCEDDAGLTEEWKPLN